MTETTPAATPILSIVQLRKSFGALVATDDVSLDVMPGELHALIGPNGAGKSTLITQICGEIRPSAGRILFEGRDVTRLPAPARARLGLGRTFQITQLCNDFTAIENVLLSIEARHGGSFDMVFNPRRNRASMALAESWLEQVGLAGRGERPVSSLAHGERRQLEIAVALAREPRLLLLDEPAAGMNDEETDELADWILTAKQELDLTVVMIEHDMGMVTRLGDRALVLDFGTVVTIESPRAAIADPRVISAYLGDETVEADDPTATGTLAVGTPRDEDRKAEHA